jgi:Zn-dependent protease/predicted transcriptional regulator
MSPKPRKPVSFRWSFKIARIGGIDVRVHITTALLFAWVLFEHARAGDLGIAIEGLALVACTFVIITLHELGHALMARRYGIATRDITLLPIGGVGGLERLPEKSSEEIAVAFAGPMVNVGLAAIAFGFLVLRAWGLDVAQLRFVGGPFVAKFLVINLSLAAFNLLPVFPMDGGRVFRAVMGHWLPRPQATAVAVRVGQVLAFLMGATGVFYSPNLVLIALLIWFGGQQELEAVRVAGQLSGLTAADAMVSQYVELDAETPIAQVAELSTAGFQHAFPVRSRGELVGLLSRQDLLRAQRKGAQSLSVGQALHGQLMSVERSTPLVDAVSRMQEQRAQAAVVLDHGVAVGLLTRENIAERVLAAHG